MNRFSEGDRVRVDVPDEADPDYERLHGEHGTIIEVRRDDAGTLTGDERDNVLFRVDLDDGQTVDLRWRDMRPAIE